MPPPPAPRPVRTAGVARPSCPIRRPAGSGGQATLEYIAVVAVVTIVLATVGTVTAGPAIANAVGGAFQRALCTVTGAGCRTLTPPVCTVRTAGTDFSGKVTVTFVRLGRTAAILRTERSDGTIDVTLLDKIDGELVAVAGATGRLELGGHELGLGGVAEAAAVAELGGGRVWRMPDGAAADRLQRKLVQVLVGRTGSALPVIGHALSLAQRLAGVGTGVRLPHPAQRIASAKAGVKLEVEGPLGSDLEAAAGAAAGGSRDLVAGGGTVYVSLEGSAGAAALGGLAGLEAVREVKLAVTVDRHGRPATVTLISAGRVGAKLTGQRGGDGRPELKGAAGDERSTVVTSTLDVASGAPPALGRLLRALGRGLPDLADVTAAARELGREFAAGARVDVATYGRRQQRFGGEAEAGLGPGLGVGLEVARSHSVLLDARTRPPGGLWEPRLDCLARV